MDSFNQKLNENKTLIMAIVIIILILAAVWYYYRYMYSNSSSTNIEKYTEIPDSEIQFSENKIENDINIHSDKIEEFIDEKKNINENENNVYLDVSIDGNADEKIEIKLYDDIVPKTANNFRELCKNKKYKNTNFHRIIKNFMLQGGDFTNGDGTGGFSIYGDKFEDENFNLKHTKSGLLSMANAGPNTNGSQFFITTVPTPHLDGKHVVFGEVVSDLNFIKTLENVQTNNNDKPIKNCMIKDCGLHN